MRVPPWLALVLLGVLLVAASWWRLEVGPSPDDAAVAAQVLSIRKGHLVSGLLVGASLALAGVLLQGLLRNPLASPDIMGLASGAGLAVMLAGYIGYRLGTDVLGGGRPLGPAVFGSFAALALVYLLSQRRGVIDPVSMVLVGVIVSITATAGTMLIQQLMPDRGLHTARWLFGGLDEEAGTPRRVACAGILLIVGGWAMVRSRVFDAAMMSADEARSVGIRLGRVRAFQFVGSGVLTGGAVALAGPVGFVGLVAPHLARGLVGPRHAWSQPASMLIGALLVVAADASIRVFEVASGRLPLGVLTALLGGPFFLTLLVGGKGRGGHLR
ncbi:MAG: iron ABC transporter permease [Leptolyngbya sp. PLA3]|nr:MAG: iron ABC transporter permease [Cyanobacteria bacterium CYA]MCE7968628.1 iron ABC transporter permease [Leptolyngbya sp. PL-A3]